MANPTYKHLESKLRLGPLSLSQWSQVLASAVLGLVFAVYISPFGPMITIFVSLVGAGLPAACAYGAMDLEFSIGELARAGARFYRSPRQFMPGPGRSPATGYRIQIPPAPAVLDDTPDRVGRTAVLASHNETERKEQQLWDF